MHESGCGISLLIAIAICLDARTSMADEPQSLTASAELDVGYSNGGFDEGFGARVGSTLSNGFYFGAAVTFQPAQRITFYGDTSPPTASVAPMSLVYTGVELGGDIRTGIPLTIRPYGAPGFGFVLSQGNNNNHIPLALWTGVRAAYALPRTPLFVALEVRAMITTAEGVIGEGSIGAFAGIGVKFGCPRSLP